MAKTIRNGDLFSGTGTGDGVSNPLHSHAGRLIALLISHAETTTQTLTLYDLTTMVGAGTDDVLAVIHVAPEQSPYHVRFPREGALEFANGLCLDAGSTIDVLVWSVDHG